MKRILCAVITLVALGASAFAGGSRAQQPSGASQAQPSQPATSSSTTVRWAYWGAQSRVEISQQAINLFQAANPGITISPEVSGGSGDHFPKIDTQLAGGNGPDIIQMGGNINDYVVRNVLLPLDPYVGNLIDTAPIDAGGLATGVIGGKLYGLSTGGTIPTLVYNKSLLERAGAPLPKVSMTYDEFRDYLTTIKPLLPDGVYPMMDIGALSSNSTPFGYWLRYNGTPIYVEESRSTQVTAEVAQKYLDLFKDYRDNGLIPPADVAAGFAETNADSSSLIAGKTAFTFIVSTQLAGYQAMTQDELSLIELPGAAATKALWVQPSQFYTVNKDSKNIEAALKFINFLVNSPDAAKVLGNDRGVSFSSTARAGITSGSAADQKLIEYQNVAGPHTSAETPHLPNDTELNSTLYLLYQQVAFGQVSTAQGGQQIYEMIVRLINK
ncbi:MAG: extracellular solute-binding protein [Treponema sp.]|jgi:multiple sugar transport system substrate-binding protein|nr:extracellular solute-binding protein [Treponema sp.]